MDTELVKKARELIYSRRVMTLAVSCDDIPWSSPVYFVFHDNGFYFFSNENSRHIQHALDNRKTGASIFHDSDVIDRIFGFQMSGTIHAVSKKVEYFSVVKAYVSKFSFLKKVFGPQILENKRFFLEKFKSQLYCFDPDRVCLSDNSKTSGKRSELDLSQIL